MNDVFGEVELLAEKSRIIVNDAKSEAGEERLQKLRIAQTYLEVAADKVRAMLPDPSAGTVVGPHLWMSRPGTKAHAFMREDGKPQMTSVCRGQSRHDRVVWSRDGETSKCLLCRKQVRA